MTKTFRYGTAVIWVVAALTLRLGMEPILGQRFPLMVFALAVLGATHFAGRSAGMVATVLSVPLACFFFVEPRYSFAVADLGDAGGLCLLALTGAGISLLAGRPTQGGDAGGDQHALQANALFVRRAVLLGSACVLLAVLTQLLYADFLRERNRQVWNTHTIRLLTAIATLRSSLEDAESGQRGYLLTADRKYLAPYYKAMLSEEGARQELSKLTAGNLQQQARLREMDSLVATKFSELRLTIELRDSKGLEAALAVVRRDQGKGIMDECRARLQAVEDAERAALDRRLDVASSQDRLGRWVLGLGSSSLLLLLVFAGGVIERDIQSREQARLAVRKSEDRLRLALDAANAGSWEWNLRTNENVWSDELWKVYGLEPNSVTPSYEAWRQLVHPDDRCRAAREVADAARLGTELNVEFRVEDRRGARWVLSRAQPLRDSKGEVTCFIGIALDITQRKQAEEALRERESNLRSFTEVAPVAIAMFDREMRYLAASQRFRDEYQLGNQELIGRSHYAVFPEIGDAWKKVHRSGLAGKVEHHPGERFLRSDGSEQWIRWEIQPWRHAHGEIGGVVLFSEDVTTQRVWEHALQTSEARLRLAQQVAGIGTFELDLGTGRGTWTPELEAMYGLAPGEFSGTAEAWAAMVHPEDREKAVRGVEDAMDTGIFEGEWRVIQPDGSVRWLAARGSVFRDEAGKPLRMVGVNMDISERKQAEVDIRQLNAHLEQRVRQRTAELQIANKELESFAYSVSHDLRAPLRGIDGWSLALAEDYAGQLDERAHQYLGRVRSETQRMGSLIDDMLKLSRVSCVELQFMAADLTAIAQRIAERLTEEYRERRLDFVIQPGLSVCGDGQQLEIALTNLLSNAVKFSGPRNVGRIEFLLEEEAGERAFCVRDNGVGFDMTYAGSLFGAFQRLHKASEFPGTGIGLAIVQRVIHRHHGRVWAKAERDRGAAFYFTIGSEA